MNRAYYSATIAAFLSAKPTEILGELTGMSSFDVQTTQIEAWREQIRILQSVLPFYRERGKLYFEYSIPRLGKRIDVVAVIDQVIFILEFKVGEREFTSSAIDQVWDYALDLKNFHETSHQQIVAPILIATDAEDSIPHIEMTPQHDKSLLPIKANKKTLGLAIEKVLECVHGTVIDATHWEIGRYSPTPTIVEAALALYRDHSVADIARSDASATNLRETSAVISEIVLDAKTHGQKSICFLTGVPGAGKTLGIANK